MENMICMQRSDAYSGAPHRYTQKARSFGVEFTTHAVLCSEHASRLGSQVQKQGREIDKKVGRQLGIGERSLEWR